MFQDGIIQEAIEQLKLHTTIEGVWSKQTVPEIDGRLVLHINNKNYQTYVDIKKELRQYQLHQLQQLQKEYTPLMVVAENIFPKIKEELRKEGINYLETNGNIYFRQGDALLWIDGQKTISKPREKTGRAFTKTGLKVVFHFLLQEDWVNLTYRDIANRTGIGFGNINFIIMDLKEQGFLIPVNKKDLKLVNKTALLHKWMGAYKEKLKPALLVGRFRFLKEEDATHWKRVPLRNMKTWWGGEPAADLLTNYLKPEELTLYTTETKPELIKNYRLIPDEKGNVHAYQKFWQYEEVNDNIVPPLLVYIDLLNNGDRRSLQAAEKIKHDLLQDKI